AAALHRNPTKGVAFKTAAGLLSTHLSTAMDTLTRSRGWFDVHRAEALDVIRIYLGLALVVRGGLFLADPVAYLNLVPEAQGDGFLVSGLLMHYVALAHIGGGLLLAVGLATR